ncbi:MAG: hypothetical protein R6W76_02805, partial [Caldilinea sp.]
AASKSHVPAQLEARILEPNEHDQARALVNRANAEREGFVIVDEALWHWRKAARPAELPAEILGVMRNGQLLGTATLCPVRVVGAHGPEEVTYLVDLGLEPGGAEETLAAGVTIVQSGPEPSKTGQKQNFSN